MGSSESRDQALKDWKSGVPTNSSPPSRSNAKSMVWRGLLASVASGVAAYAGWALLSMLVVAALIVAGVVSAIARARTPETGRWSPIGAYFLAALAAFLAFVAATVVRVQQDPRTRYGWTNEDRLAYFDSCKNGMDQHYFGKTDYRHLTSPACLCLTELAERTYQNRFEAMREVGDDEKAPPALEASTLGCLDKAPAAYDAVLSQTESKCLADGGTPIFCRCFVTALRARWPAFSAYVKESHEPDVRTTMGEISDRCRR